MFGSHAECVAFCGYFQPAFFVSTLLLTGCSQTTSTQNKQDISSSTNESEVLSSQDITSPTPSAAPAQSPQSTSQVLGSQTVTVTAVIDGDTIEIEGGQRIRYIGINTPETVDPRKPVECFGREASNKNKELVAGKSVRLEKDISETDKYRRLLRYVFIGDVFVNDYLVRQGYAYASSYPPDVKYQNQFNQAEREAKINGRGLWSTCSTSTTNTPQAATTPQSTNGSNCDPSYPTVCIPASPPDLDCPDITYRRFQVLSPDTHRFDGDNDGIGCES
ncbi:MAG: WD40 domain protein beta Propeller [Candidatus Curtissbacteria bacterium GW2011_GWA1_40_16]|uniref:WD40 domain protein beta Propeller n=1 Tax=Candidatus Curtissbacteria bacterium GW2011_GWA1_40_16 TaxID=1618405 RepID=A0A0G0RE78_9BACT|nr:MAG: WD40 domain protein beta Propeller [Candidatus Curtissbacteria bacterium GW2011_GWA1_40_16]